jgi:hypothetical protein
MTWQCELVTREAIDEKYDKGEPIPIGWMWYPNPEGIDEELLSYYYKEHNQQNRQALFIQLPDGVWCMDGLASGDPTKKGWTVTGEPPNITVAPSINSNRGNRKGYHGFLQNGVLTDDLEGRTYDDNR